MSIYTVTQEMIEANRKGVQEQVTVRVGQTEDGFRVKDLISQLRHFEDHNAWHVYVSHCYSDDSIVIQGYASRPENDTEVVERLQKAHLEEERLKRAELAELERLEKKYRGKQ